MAKPAEKKEAKPKKEKRYFVLLDPKTKEEKGIFTGKSPRQAALKAANRGVTEIWLRERGTNKIHIFTGSRVKTKAPPSKPAWMPDEIWKPKVSKVRVEKLEKPKKAAPEKPAKK